MPSHLKRFQTEGHFHFHDELADHFPAAAQNGIEIQVGAGSVDFLTRYQPLEARITS
jgi:hypothetical protein